MNNYHFIFKEHIVEQIARNIILLVSGRFFYFPGGRNSDIFPLKFSLLNRVYVISKLVYIVPVISRTASTFSEPVMDL